MKGTFKTVTYDSRADYVAQRPSSLFVQHNDFTAVGLEWLWSVALGNLRAQDGGMLDHLDNARLVVGNGDAAFSVKDTRLAGAETAMAELDEGFPRADGMIDPGDDGGPSAYRVTFQGTFTEFEANFDWRERGLVSSQGVLIDRSVSDQGRKAPGTIWTTSVSIDLG